MDREYEKLTLPELIDIREYYIHEHAKLTGQIALLDDVILHLNNPELPLEEQDA